MPTPIVPSNNEVRSSERLIARFGYRRGCGAELAVAIVARVAPVDLRHETATHRSDRDTRSRCSSANRAANRKDGAAAGQDRSAWSVSRCSSALRLRRADRAGGRFRPSVPSSCRAACTMCARSSTENCSVNWLNTRNSPGAAGCVQAISMQRTVSRMSRKPRVCPPLP